MSSKLPELETKSAPAASTRPGILFVVSSPSGGGKGTLIRRLLDVVPDLSYSVSYTTRAPRNGEVNGREYFFVDRPKFQEMIAGDEFLEWACVHGNQYGTSKHRILQETGAGLDIVLEVDVQGAASVRGLDLDSVGIFILPPSYEILRQRLITRGTDTPEELAVRLHNAPAELRQYSLFDFVIINDDAEQAAQQLASIVKAERSRCKRQESLILEVINDFNAG
jgi:guanylate kinase